MNIKYLKLAINESKKSALNGEIPIGAVIVKNDQILAIAHNTKEKEKCCIFHAEINAIIEACEKNNNWRLDECDMYVSFEPCPMCASAIRQSRIRNVYCALSNSNSKNTQIIDKIFNELDINPKVLFYNDLLPIEMQNIMKKFFENKRKNSNL